MTRIVIFSDTHRNIKDAINVLDNLINVDMVIHLGDCVADAYDLKSIFKDIPFYYVSGNNDFYSDRPNDMVVETDGIKIFCTHGHNYNLDRLVSKAKDSGCKIALFGHTHRSFTDTTDNIKVINPGSISRPRDGRKSYAIIEIEDKKINSCIIEVQSFN